MAVVAEGGSRLVRRILATGQRRPVEGVGKDGPSGVLFRKTVDVMVDVAGCVVGKFRCSLGRALGPAPTVSLETPTPKDFPRRSNEAADDDGHVRCGAAGGTVPELVARISLLRSAAFPTPLSGLVVILVWGTHGSA